MNLFIKSTRTACLALLLVLLFSENIGTAQDLQISQTKTPELTILLREFNQPYAFDNGTGIISEIFQETLGKTYKLNFVFLPFERGLLMLENKEIDVISVAPVNLNGSGSIYFSKPYIEFKNKIFALENTGPAEISLESLEHLETLAFINARIFLGEEFAARVNRNSKYKEIQDQQQQVLTLLKGRVELAILEQNIFSYQRQQLINQGELDEKIKYRSFDIFPSSNYCAIFHDGNLAKEFDNRIDQLQTSGKYSDIIASYTGGTSQSK